MSRVVGIDLASQPRETAVCVIDWAVAPARVELLARGRLPGGGPLDDAALLELIDSAEHEKVAIDAPFGWPADFVRAVAGHARHERWPLAPGAEAADRMRLALRETDRWVARVTGEDGRRAKRPLSVSTDLIAYPAMRCAALLAAARRVFGGRDGDGRVLEAYPDAALREWGLLPGGWDAERVGYKGKDAATRRAELVEVLRSALAGVVELSPSDVTACERSDDALDALVCALVARAWVRGLTVGAPEDLRSPARAEGWIHVPRRGTTLAALAQPRLPPQLTQVDLPDWPAARTEHVAAFARADVRRLRELGVRWEEDLTDPPGPQRWALVLLDDGTVLGLTDEYGHEDGRLLVLAQVEERPPREIAEALRLAACLEAPVWVSSGWPPAPGEDADWVEPATAPRPARREDAEPMAVIYNEGIRERVATFETRERTAAEVAEWLDGGLPVVVAEREGEVVGFARISPYSDRCAYGGVGEHGVYVKRWARGGGVGRDLLRALCAEAERAGLYKLTARILVSNEPSLRAHRAAGFREVGVQERHGRLDGEWRDVVLVERLLGEAAS